MRSFGRPTAPIAAVLALVLACILANSQTKIDMRSQARNIDFSAATSTRPFPIGTALPALCSVGQTFFKSNAVPGQNLYYCTATNIWSVGAGNSLPTQASNAGKLLGTNGTTATWRTFSGFTDDGSRLMPDGTLVGELAGNNNWTGQQRFPASTTQMLTSATERITCNRRTIAVSAAAPLTLSTAATILDGADGQVCVIVNVGLSSITLQDQDTRAGSNLQLISAQLVLPSKGQITLQYNQTIGDWIQEGVQMSGAGSFGELAGDNNWTGQQRFPTSATQTLTGATDRITCNRRTIAVSAAAPLTLSSAATILDGTDGQVCVIVNVGPSSITLQDQDTLAGSNLQLTSAQLVLPSKGQITLQYNQTIGDWIQEGVQTNTTVTGMLQDTGTTGIVTQVGTAGFTTVRTINGANGITVTNGSAVSGNPTISLPGSNKGDLIVHDGTSNARLAVGPKRGHFLSADPSAPQGVSYIPGVYMYKSYLADTIQLNNVVASPHLRNFVIAGGTLTDGDRLECRATWFKSQGVDTATNSVLAFTAYLNGGPNLHSTANTPNSVTSIEAVFTMLVKSATTQTIWINYNNLSTGGVLTTSALPLQQSFNLANDLNITHKLYLNTSGTDDYFAFEGGQCVIYRRGE